MESTKAKQPNPPEYRLMVFMCECAGTSLLEFLELCTFARHRKIRQESPLVTELQNKFGKEWFMDLFSFATREFKVAIIDEKDDETLKNMFSRRQLSRYRIRMLAEEYCDRVAALFGLPIPIEFEEEL